MGNKADDNQRNTECDQLSENVFYSDYNIHKSLIGNLANQDISHHSEQQPEWQIIK